MLINVTSVVISSFVIILLMIVGYIIHDWAWLQQPAQASLLNFLFAFSGAAAGGGLSCYGGYLGGIKGAKHTAALTVLLEKQKSIKLLRLNLGLTINVMQKLMEAKQLERIERKTFLFDRDWLIRLSNIEELTDEEVDTIIRWFDTIERIEESIRSKGYILKSDLKRVYENIDEKSLMETVNKLSKLLEQAV